jgi:hypothetical protein
VQERPPRYRAYMLRCWEARGERPDQPGTWRFSLECVQTKEKRGFEGLEELVAFLRGGFELEERIGGVKAE